MEAQWLHKLEYSSINKKGEGEGLEEGSDGEHQGQQIFPCLYNQPLLGLNLFLFIFVIINNVQNKKKKAKSKNRFFGLALFF